MQALFTVNLRDEAVDVARASTRSAKALPLICSALSVFMKLSALALSKGLPGLLMLMVMSRAVQYLKGKSSHKLLTEYQSLRKRYWGQHL
ncbi:MAG TPA: hypothetical protein VGR99_37070 [Bradyrhizobium sp.]|jgi:hypothetical protein|nr:hypothetical protein [Bradyrhizobium sp.]HEV2160017.1 hypothetical protein [Bradyrhizobium sp.]